MKNDKHEWLGRMQRQYHRSHPWRLSQCGLFIPHSYADTKLSNFSEWDDVGFILNGRRVIVWWQHPRNVYADILEEQSFQEAGEGPNDDWITKDSTKNYCRLGASRKKITSYTCRQPSAEQKQYYDLLRDIQARLTSEGVDLEVSPSWRRRRLPWATGVNLVAPLEVRNEVELTSVALLARQLILGQTTLEVEFPGYRYSRADWLREQTV